MGWKMVCLHMNERHLPVKTVTSTANAAYTSKIDSKIKMTRCQWPNAPKPSMISSKLMLSPLLSAKQNFYTEKNIDEALFCDTLHCIKVQQQIKHHSCLLNCPCVQPFDNTS